MVLIENIRVKDTGDRPCDECGITKKGFILAVKGGTGKPLFLCARHFRETLLAMQESWLGLQQRRSGRPHGPCCLDDPLMAGRSASCDCPYTRARSVCGGERETVTDHTSGNVTWSDTGESLGVGPPSSATQRRSLSLGISRGPRTVGITRQDGYADTHTEGNHTSKEHGESIGGTRSEGQSVGGCAMCQARILSELNGTGG